MTPIGSTYTQNARLFRLDCPALPKDTLLLSEFRGVEGVSMPFEFILGLLSEDADIPLKSMMAQPVLVSLATASGEDRHFHGYVTDFRFLSSDGGFARYEATIAPWTTFLDRGTCCQVNQGMSVIDILKKVFAKAGLLARTEFRARGSFPRITLSVEYNETDWNYACRLMEEYGLYYYYRHDKGGHTLVVDNDSRMACTMPGQPKIGFEREPGASEEDAIDQFGSGRHLVANKYASKTYDYKNPRDDMYISMPANRNMGPGIPAIEHYEDSGLYAYAGYEAGRGRARQRIEELELRRELFFGSGNCRHLASGNIFELAGHFGTGPGPEDCKFFVLVVTHSGRNNLERGDGEEVYRNTFSCVRKATTFRPARRTPRPVISGIQTATVVGIPGEEICCDKWGRLRIQFPWDREGKFNDHSFCDVRMASPWAGDRFGFISIPRKGSEVIVAFANGDPDRPIVIGSLYNADHMPPWDLPNNKTQTGILTRSTRDSGYHHANALRFEDAKGREELWLHAEKDQRIEVENDESHTVGNDRSKTIGGNETSSVQKNRTETVSGDDSLEVTGGRVEKARTISLEASDGIRITCGASVIEITPSGITLNGDVVALNP